MSSGSAATSTPKYMQNCDTYLRRRSFWRTKKKNRPPKKIGKSGQSEKYSGSFVVFERGVNFRCFSDLLSKKNKTPKQASNGIWSLDVLLFLSRWISDIEESKVTCSLLRLSHLPCFPQDLGTRHDVHTVVYVEANNNGLSAYPNHSQRNNRPFNFQSLAFLEKNQLIQKKTLSSSAFDKVVEPLACRKQWQVNILVSSDSSTQTAVFKNHCDIPFKILRRIQKEWFIICSNFPSITGSRIIPCKVHALKIPWVSI